MNRHLRRKLVKIRLSKRSKTNTPSKYQTDKMVSIGTSYDNTQEYYRGLATKMTKKFFRNMSYNEYWGNQDNFKYGYTARGSLC